MRLARFLVREKIPWGAKLSRWWRQHRLTVHWSLLWFLFFLAVGVRVAHFASDHWIAYVHDLVSHLIRVEYTASHGENPPLDGEWSFAQQPFYYWSAATAYDSDLSREDNQVYLGAFGLDVSVGALCLLFLSLHYLSSWLVRYMVFSYLAFTPILILNSSCVGNDSFIFFFGIYFFFCFLRVHRHPHSPTYFWLAIAAVLLALFSKLSALVMLAGLPWLFWRRAVRDKTWWPTVGRAALTAALLAVLAGITLAQHWDKNQHSIRLVNYALWDYMRIPHPDVDYYATFNLSEILRTGQTTPTDSSPDSVRFSYLNYQYGTSLIGEYEYSTNPVLGFWARAVLLTGTLLLFGLALSFALGLLGYPLVRAIDFHGCLKTAVLIIIGSNLLLMDFIFTIPETCSADFRYQNITLPWIAYAVARGLNSFPRQWAVSLFGWVLGLAYIIASLTLIYFLDTLR